LVGLSLEDNNNNNNNNNNNFTFALFNMYSLDTETTDKWYTHMPKSVYEEGDVTMMWNQAVNTDREF